MFPKPDAVPIVTEAVSQLAPGGTAGATAGGTAAADGGSSRRVSGTPDATQTLPPTSVPRMPTFMQGLKQRPTRFATTLSATLGGKADATNDGGTPLMSAPSPKISSSSSLTAAVAAAAATMKGDGASGGSASGGGGGGDAADGAKVPVRPPVPKAVAEVKGKSSRKLSPLVTKEGNQLVVHTAGFDAEVRVDCMSLVCRWWTA